MKTFLFVAGLSASFALAGCSSDSESLPSSTTTTTTQETSSALPTPDAPVHTTTTTTEETSSVTH